jgi:hypothetical protein
MKLPLLERHTRRPAIGLSTRDDRRTLACIGANAGKVADMRDVEKLLAPSVAATINALDLEDTDRAAAKLSETYAAAIDAAQAAETWADSVLRKVDKDTDLYDEVRALKLKLSARAALSDYGPKLLAVMVELGATPKAQAAIGKTKPATADPASDAATRIRLAMPGA